LGGPDREAHEACLVGGLAEEFLGAGEDTCISLWCHPLGEWRGLELRVGDGGGGREDGDPEAGTRLQQGQSGRRGELEQAVDVALGPVGAEQDPFLGAGVPGGQLDEGAIGRLLSQGA
jgi:hypothetical protein